jgi:hypothetical protein
MDRSEEIERWLNLIGKIQEHSDDTTRAQCKVLQSSIDALVDITLSVDKIEGRIWW